MQCSGLCDSGNGPRHPPPPLGQDMHLSEWARIEAARAPGPCRPRVWKRMFPFAGGCFVILMARKRCTQRFNSKTLRPHRLVCAVNVGYVFLAEHAPLYYPSRVTRQMSFLACGTSLEEVTIPAATRLPTHRPRHGGQRTDRDAPGRARPHRKDLARAFPPPVAVLRNVRACKLILPEPCTALAGITTRPQTPCKPPHTQKANPCRH